jgi:hypothetical protein
MERGIFIYGFVFQFQGITTFITGYHKFEMING